MTLPLFVGMETLYESKIPVYFIISYKIPLFILPLLNTTCSHKHVFSSRQPRPPSRTRTLCVCVCACHCAWHWHVPSGADGPWSGVVWCRATCQGSGPKQWRPLETSLGSSAQNNATSFCFHTKQSNKNNMLAATNINTRGILCCASIFDSIGQFCLLLVFLPC